MVKHYDYIIVGGGMASAAAAAGIRRRDKRGTVGIFSAERYPMYSRPPLSKRLWTDERIENIWMRPDAQALHADEHLATVIETVDRDTQTIHDQYGHTYHYGKLLLAVGGTPKTLPFPDVPILYFHTLDDYFQLYRLTRSANRFLIIGGGFIGTEIAAALSLLDKTVTMIFPESHLVDRLFPEDLKNYIDTQYRQHHISLWSQSHIASLTRNAQGIVVTDTSGRSCLVDAVVAGVGFSPNTALAEKAGLTVQDGIVVNEFLQTSDPNIYAAGDVCEFPYPYPHQKRRVEHEDNALAQGKAAGLNMAGAEKPYTHLPFFYSDMFHMGYEAIGRLDSTLEIFADWVTFGEEGVLYYLHDHRVVGILNWNVWNQIPQAREIITSQALYATPSQLRGILRNTP